MLVRDEVCGMEFPASRAVASFTFQDKVYYFCAERCRLIFQQNPHWYVPVTRGAGESD